MDKKRLIYNLWGQFMNCPYNCHYECVSESLLRWFWLGAWTKTFRFNRSTERSRRSL